MSEEIQSDFTFYTVGEVAQILSVSKVTVYRLVESGKLTSFKIQGCVRISGIDINQYLDECKRSSGIS